MPLPTSLYLVTCLPTGERYCGITTRTVARRWSIHLWTSYDLAARGKLHQAIARYGEENFAVETLHVYDLAVDAAHAEVAVIAGLDLYRTGLNSSRGGEKSAAFVGSPRSEETKRKMREAMARRLENPAWIEKMREVAKKRSENPEYLKKLSESALGRKHSQETKDKLAAAQFGKRFVRSAETRAKMSLSRMGKKHAPEVYARMAATQKKRLSDPEVRKRISMSLTGKKQGPRSAEHCAKISEYKKRYWAKWREARAA